MILIIETWLTISAWRNGWGPLALLPLGLALTLGFVIGANAGPSGIGPTEFALAIAGDIGAIFALAMMSQKAPATMDEAQAELTPVEAPLTARVGGAGSLVDRD